MRWPVRAIAGAMLAAGLATACGSGPGTPAAAPTPTTTRDPAPREAIEVDVEGLPLGEFDRSDLEFSGLDRWGDRVVILPQYPERLGNALLAFDVTALDAFLDGRSAELPIEHVPFDGSAVELEFDAEPNLGVFEGYEAIAFAGDRVFLTVEVHGASDGAVGYLVHGHVDPERGVVLDDARIPLGGPYGDAAPASARNLGFEALFVERDAVFALFERNDASNPSPMAERFTLDASARSTVPMGHVEYRITDATTDPRTGRIWVTNYHWPPSPWTPGRDPLRARWGTGPTQGKSQAVERIVELEWHGGRLAPAPRPPIDFKLAEVNERDSRNWEGIAYIEGRGFVVVTDEHPRSILGFVPFDANAR